MPSLANANPAADGNMPLPRATARAPPDSVRIQRENDAESPHHRDQERAYEALVPAHLEVHERRAPLHLPFHQQ